MGLGMRKKRKDEGNPIKIDRNKKKKKWGIILEASRPRYSANSLLAVRWMKHGLDIKMLNSDVNSMFFIQLLFRSRRKQKFPLISLTNNRGFPLICR
jgi:hypothetical protein